MKVTSKQLLDLFGLKVGDKLHIEDIYFIVKKFINDELYLDNEGYCSSLMRLIDKDFEIIKHKPQLTEDENVILRNTKYKYIARDKDGDLFCGNKLGKDDSLWYPYGEEWNYLTAFNHLFQFIACDEEPYNIKELLDE